ncbi:MAG: aspartate-semialdehyde dehydrogenase [Bdellovibrionales bacterium]|nr:aspartate-semialdehyde dehydrogenase [Bdellovibrionales bacterium]
MPPAPLLRIGVVGATGMVGTEFIRILNERKFPIDELRLFASDKSQGSEIAFREKKVAVQGLSEGCFKNLDVVFFSSGDPISKEWAPIAVKAGAVAIDNSGAFRMNPEIPLVVPEVNGHMLPKSPSPCIISNPNCSTIQLVVALNPIKKNFGLKEVRVATYQSVSGAGKAGVDELNSQTAAVMNFKSVQPSTFPHQIAFNNIPQIGSIDESGYCSEEMKIMNESRKILDLPQLRITAFTVRTPTLNGHSEAVWVTTEREASRQDFLNCLKRGSGLVVEDDSINSKYPLNWAASGQDPVFVGRVHQDPMDSRTWLMWVVADNVRKGAATNGIQIAEHIFDLNRG